MEVALDLGFVNQEQINKVIEQQKNDVDVGVSKTLGDYLFEQRVITLEQVKKNPSISSD